MYPLNCLRLLTPGVLRQVAMLESTLKAVVQYHSILPASRTRDQLALVETLQTFPAWFSSVQMYEMVIPILFDLMEDGARPVQLLATQALLRCIRRNEIASHRYSLLSKLRSEYGHSKSYWRRMLFLDASVFATTLNSRQYCRQNFFEVAIDMLDDPVPNVRLKAISLVPVWRQVLTSLGDNKLLDRIRQFLEEATTDSDRDVAFATAEARQAIEASDLDNRRLQRRPQDDVEDKRKLSEEETLGMTSDHEDSSADSRWSSMLEYTLVVGKDGQVVRRARVKSLDLVNKVTRSQGKDTGRGGGSSSSTSSNGSVGNGGLSMNGSGGASSIALSMMLGSVKGDPIRSKTSNLKSSSGNKPGPTLTLPNCATARPPAGAKTQQGLKVMGSTGKLAAAGGKTAGSSLRSTSATAKEVGAITKIPNIRPSAPAKRENSPSTGIKPSTTVPMAPMTTPSAPTTASGTSSGGLGASGVKSRLGAISDGMGGPGAGTVALKPKAMAPTVAKR